MKRLLVLLVVLAGGVAAAAVAIPTNAVVVDGTAISQQTLNADVRAIAASPEYQCYLNANEYVASNGSAQIPPVEGAGAGNPGHGTATTAFTASYLDVAVPEQILLNAAAQRGVTATPGDLSQARANFEQRITTVMQETYSSGNPALTCGTTSPLTGAEVLATVPSDFVARQVTFLATATALGEQVAGVASSEAGLVRYYVAHRGAFDTVCGSYAVFTSQPAAADAAAAVAYGSPFSSVASSAVQSGALRCETLSDLAAALQTSVGSISGVAVGGASAPISSGGAWIIVAPSSRTATPYAQARSSVVVAVQTAGAAAAQRLLASAARRADVAVNPQYGTWVSGVGSVFTPLAPRPADVLNAAANEPASASASAGASSG